MEMVVGNAKTIVGLVLEITEAVKTVRQNEEECRHIADWVAINSNLLKRLEGTNMAKDEDMCKTLEGVKSRFEEALKLVKKCQKKHFIRRFLWSKDMASDLHRMQDDIGRWVQQALLACNVYETVAVDKLQHTVAALNSTLPSVIPGEMVVPRQNVVEQQFIPEHEDPGQEFVEGNETRLAALEQQKFIPEHEDPGQEFVEGSTRFSLSMMKEATNNFTKENIIGRGGFSDIYKGVLQNGKEVAIKKFHFSLDLEGLMFCNEFDICAKLEHRNVVKLMGYCIEVKVTLVYDKDKYVQAEERQTLLVLGYVPNGSLNEITEGTRHIDWSSCFKILQEVAQAVQYLHEKRIIHSDLTPANILLDNEMSPVIIDFGVSKILDPGAAEIKLNDLKGTVGYMAPEQYSGRQSLKSDVFTFGTTLLQTIVSVCTASKTRPWNGRETWVKMLHEAGGPENFFDPRSKINLSSQLEEINRCVEVGLRCTGTDETKRPTMADVTQMLSGEKELPTHRTRYWRRVQRKK